MNNDKESKNILYLCKECSKEVYPRKGKFTIEEIKKAQFIKKLFNDKEHMWIKIAKIEDNEVIGTLANDPQTSNCFHLKFGDKVSARLEEIEDIMGDNIEATAKYG